MLQLSVEHVSISYERTMVLKDISFSVEEGDYICIVGKNMVLEKSSLIKGNIRFDSTKGGGKVIFSGEELARACWLSASANTASKRFSSLGDGGCVVRMLERQGMASILYKGGEGTGM